MPRLEDFIGAQAPGGRRAQPGDFGSGAGLAQLGRAVTEIGGVLEQFTQAEITQRSNAEAAEVRAELSELLADPLLTLDQFETGAKEIVKQHQATLPFPKTKADFSLKVEGLLERGRAQVRGAQMKRLADEATAHLDRLTQTLTDQFGQATSPEVKAEIIDEFLHKLDVAQQQRVIGAQDRFNREKIFLKEGLGGDIRQAIREAREGPFETAGSAVLGLLRGTLGRGLDEADLQAWITTATNAYDTDLRRRNAQAARIERIGKAAAVREHKAATNELDLLLDISDRGTAEEAAAAMEKFEIRLQANFDLFSREEKSFYRDAQRAGGGLGGGETDPQVYVQFNSLASVGAVRTIEDDPNSPFLSDQIEKAYRNGDLRRADMDRLLATQDDRRFGDAENFLKLSLNVAETALGRDPFTQQQKSAQALQAFIDWKIENPRASREDAQKFVERLIRAASFIALTELEIANLVPFYRVPDPKNPLRTDTDATYIRTKRAHDEGELNTFDYQTQLGWIERVEAAQKRLEKQ